MFRLFGHAVSAQVAALALAEALIIYLAVALAALAAPDATALMIWAPIVCILAAMLALGVYEPEARADLQVAGERLGAACLLGGATAFFFLYLLAPVWVSPLYGLAAGSFSYALVMSARAAARRFGGAGAFQRRVLILGEGEPAAAAAAVLARPSSSAACVGVATLDAADESGALRSAARRAAASEIVVALADRRTELPWRDLLDCKMSGVRVIDHVAFHEHETGQVDLDNIYPARLIFSESFGHSRWALRIKRLVDMIIGALGLLILSPVLIGAAIAVRISSPGAVLYRQTRVGLGERPFEIVKFRSMRQDAEKNGAQWAAQGDNRVTRVGRFLRKTRIDELPQLWNILRGDMSLVGPRPERPVFVEQLAQDLPYYQDRHRVKPGLTGWAQINYPYGASIEDSRKKLTYDLYYMKNCSLFLDILIMFKTARVVIWGDGAR